MNINTIGENIAKFRRKRKMTQEQLAEAADLTMNYLWQIARNKLNDLLT